MHLLFCELPLALFQLAVHAGLKSVREVEVGNVLPRRVAILKPLEGNVAMFIELERCCSK